MEQRLFRGHLLRTSMQRFIGLLDQYFYTGQLESLPLPSEVLETIIEMPDMSMCAKVVPKTEDVVRCLDCGVFPLSIICLACFSASNHEGHRYKTVSGQGGICDCGNGQSWRKEGNCSRHSGEHKDVSISQQQGDIFVYPWIRLYRYILRLRDDNKPYRQLNLKLLNLFSTLALVCPFNRRIISFVFRCPAGPTRRGMSIMESVFVQPTQVAIQQEYRSLLKQTLDDRTKLEACLKFRNNYNQIMLKQGTLKTYGLDIYMDSKHIEYLLLNNAFLELKVDLNQLKNVCVLQGIQLHISILLEIAKQDIAKQYFTSYLSNSQDFVQLCQAISAIREQDGSLELPFRIEQKLLELMSKVAKVLPDWQLVNLCRQFLTICSRSQSTQRYLLPCHRILSLLLFEHIDGKLSDLKLKLSARECLSIIHPAVENIVRHNERMLVPAENLDDKVIDYCCDYAEGTIRPFSMDCVLVKMMVMQSKQHNRHLLTTWNYTITDRNIISLACLLAFIAEATASPFEQQFMCTLLNIPTYYQINRILQACLTSLPVVYLKDVKTIHLSMLSSHSLLEHMIDQTTDPVKGTIKFKAKTSRYSISLDYFFSKFMLKNNLATNSKTPNCEIKIPIEEHNEKFLRAVLNVEFIQSLVNFISIAVKSQDQRVIKALNVFTVELLKTYKLGILCCIPYMNMLKQPMLHLAKLTSQKIRKMVMDQFSIKKQQATSSKASLEQSNREKMPQIKSKQKPITEKMPQVETKPEDTCCGICQLPLTGCCIYPVTLELTNLLFFLAVRQHTQEMEPAEAQKYLQGSEQSKGIVMAASTCNHLAHFECVHQLQQIESCWQCNIKCSAFMIHSQQEATESQRTQAWDSLCQFYKTQLQLENQNECIEEILWTVWHAVGFQAVYQTQWFMKHQIKFYKDLSRILLRLVGQLQADQEQDRWIRLFLAITQGAKNSRLLMMPITLGEVDKLRVGVLHLIYFNIPYQPTLFLSQTCFRKLPPTYDGLRNYRRPCPFCNKFSQNIVLCLVCQFVGCFFCQKGGSVNDHVQRYHAWACIFLKLQTGNPIFVMFGKALCQPNIYLYSDNFKRGVNVMQGNLESYKLDEMVLKNLHKLLCQSRLESYIENKVEMGVPAIDLGEQEEPKSQWDMEIQ